MFEYINMYHEPIQLGIFLRLEYTHGVSSSKIIEKLNSTSCNNNL